MLDDLFDYGLSDKKDDAGKSEDKSGSFGGLKALEDSDSSVSDIDKGAIEIGLEESEDGAEKQEAL